MPHYTAPQPVVHLAELVLELMGDADLNEVMAMEKLRMHILGLVVISWTP